MLAFPIPIPCVYEACHGIQIADHAQKDDSFFVLGRRFQSARRLDSHTYPNNSISIPVRLHIAVLLSS
jgi:hypothetical protein